MRDAARTGLLLGDRVIGDQAARAPDLVHDLVASIDAERTLDALHLQAVADVDAHGTDHDARLAVDAIAACRPVDETVWPLACRAARLAAFWPIADEERVTVCHRALDARPGAHVDADLLARDTAEQIGRRCEDAEKQISHRGRRPRRELGRKRRRIAEVEDNGATGQQADQQP